MSRSYKKNPVIKDNRRGSKKFWKALTNNRLKQHDVASGCAYKRLVGEYNLCDYWRSMLGVRRNNWYYHHEFGGDYEEDVFNCTRK